MRTLESLVKEFNQTYKVPTNGTPTLPTEAEMYRIHAVIYEELMELNEAMDQKDIVGMADALMDIIYITAQQAYTMGLPVDRLLAEVQRSNMSKLGADGEPIFREDGKVLKGPFFSPPDLEKILLEDSGVDANEC